MQVVMALIRAFAEKAGLDPDLVLYLETSWLGTAFIDVFLVEGQDRIAMKDLLHGIAVEEMQARQCETVAYTSIS